MTQYPALFRRVYHNSAILWLIYSLIGLGLAGGAPPALAQSPPPGDQVLLVTCQGQAMLGGRTYACSLGRAGVRQEKREGDGATPAGEFSLREVLYRPDKLERAPATSLPCRPIAPDDGWCDDPADPRYNRMVKLPYPASHEKMWRDDDLYDLVVVVGYNDQPVVPGRGSAIFLHLARPGYAPTAGCVGLAREDLLDLLARLGPGARVAIQAPDGQ